MEGITRIEHFFSQKNDDIFHIRDQELEFKVYRCGLKLQREKRQINPEILKYVF